MSPLDQVLAAAKRICDEGRDPSLALIKTKLGTSIPMRVLIQGLQQFKSMSAEDKQAIASHAVNAAKQEQKPGILSPTEQADKITQLESDFSELKSEFALLKQEFDQLKQSQTATKEPDNICM